MKTVMIYPSCISSNEASQIAEQEGLEKEWMGAKSWFEGVVESREEFELQEMPKYNRFVCHMDYIESDLYYDFGSDYYFAVQNKLKTENMKKNKIRISESKLKKIVAESVKKVLNEYGNTERGQYMLGRLHRRNVEKEDMFRGADDAAFRHNKGNWETFDKGYEDEGIDIPTLKNKTIRFNHDVYKMNDMDKLGKKFISFIESDDSILQLIVDYKSGNQNGKKNSSPLPEVIPMFEEDVLGYECTPEMKKAIEIAFNEWWYYAEAQLMPDEEY